VPPISLFLTMFSKADDQQHPLPPAGTAPPTSSSSSPNPQHDNLSPPERSLVNYPTLAIYGTRDFFGSRRKLRNWAENLASQPQSLFQYREIIDAGHFWQEPGAGQELRCRIREWLRDLVGLQNDISPHTPIHGHECAGMK
jgi:pimeloyl-ACP methyl ester carboxylesterase